MNYIDYGSQQHQHYVGGIGESMASTSTINMSDYSNMSSPQYSSYQENSNSNSNPSPPSGSETGPHAHQHHQHAPYAVSVARYDEKSSKKGYIINANKKLQLTHGPPRYTRKKGPFSEGFGGGPSAHDKAIIGKYRKEMRKEGMNDPHNSQPSFQLHPQNQFNSGFGGDEIHGASSDQPPAPQRKPRGKKPSQFQQAKNEMQKRLQDKSEFTKKKKLQKAEVEQAKMNRKQKRIERNKIQTQVTSKGQPLMKGRILNLLSKIEEQHNV